jgi:hypothetical protein
MVLLIIVVVQVGITTFGGTFFHTQALPLVMWAKIIAVGLGTLILSAIFRTVGKVLLQK